MVDKTLLISYLFPPCGGVGVQRALSYARYLPEVGSQVHVLTARNPAVALEDPGLLQAVPSNVSIHRTWTPEIPYRLRQKIWGAIALTSLKSQSNAEKPATINSRWREGLKGLIQRLNTPDPQVNWSMTAIPLAARLIREKVIEHVLVTAPPFSTFGIGVELKKRFPKINLISEFRDEWLDYYIHSDPNATEYRRRVALELEQETIEVSDFVVTVTPTWVKSIRSRHPQQPEGKFLCIPNGYDPIAFADFHARPHGLARLVITYVGTVYANPVYSPRPFLAAINELPEEMRRRIEVRFIGRIAEEEVEAIQNCRAPTRRYGFLPQAEAFRHLEESDCVLLVVNTPGAQAGKVFEYLASGKPILGLCPPDGEAASLIRETRSGWTADAGDRDGVRRIIEEAYAAFVGGATERIPRADTELIASYARPKLVARLAAATGIGQADHEIRS